MDVQHSATPFVVIRLRYWSPSVFALESPAAQELLARIREVERQEGLPGSSLAVRIEEAAAHPTTESGEKRFVVGAEDEPVMLAALERGPDLDAVALVRLREALRGIVSQSAAG